MEDLIHSIKYQIASINLSQQPMYSHHLYKDVHLFIKLIRLKMPKNIYNIKEILYELYGIKFLLENRILDFPEYEALENLHELIDCTIITLNNILDSIMNYKTKII
jgi:hypothetical protein